MTVTFSEDQARDFLEYEEDDTTPVKPARLTEAVVSYILDKVNERRGKEESKAKSRTDEREAKAKRKEAELEAKRTEARERKKKAKG